LAHLLPGHQVLDVGCGPGTISADLAALVAPGSVTGVDRSHEVIELALQSVAQNDEVNIAFLVGDVYDLQFDDASFDVVYAHQVLQHLSDPVRALREMRRVLVPGGLVAVRDADYGKFTWSPSDPRLVRWMELYHDLTERNGAEADAGRHLVEWVRDAAYERWTTSTSTWHFRTDEEREWWGGLWSDRVQQSEFARQALEFDLTTPAELRDISSAFLEWATNPKGEFVVVHDEVLAWTTGQ
jgi:ubiquinone/menaquinone biosynthesis C-methylase UbiE